MGSREFFWEYDVSVKGRHIRTHWRPTDVHRALLNWGEYVGYKLRDLTITVKHEGQVVGRHTGEDWYKENLRDRYCGKMARASQARANEQRRKWRDDETAALRAQRQRIRESWAEYYAQQASA